KAASEHLSIMYHRTYNLPVVLLRFSAIYGPGQNPVKLIPMSIISALEGRNIILHSPNQKRSFLYIDDAVEGILEICFSENKLNGDIINFGSSKSHMIREVVERIIRIIGNPVEIVPEENPILSSDPPEVLSDISKARKVLGWSPITPLDKGLRKTVEWYTRNKAIQPRSR
ncbi:dTDP-glucose 4,6-dehydratase, partial [Candidatus Hakubella thermalkaliphila]